MEEDDCPPEVGAEGGGYAAAYVQLSFAAESESDLYASETAGRSFAAGLNQLISSQPTVTQLLQTLPAEKQAEVQKLMAG